MIELVERLRHILDVEAIVRPIIWFHNGSGMGDATVDTLKQF